MDCTGECLATIVGTSDRFFLGMYLIVAAFELWAFIHPRSFWFAGQGWKFKNVEPSLAMLTYIRWQAPFVVLGLTLLYIFVLQGMDTSPSAPPPAPPW